MLNLEPSEESKWISARFWTNYDRNERSLRSDFKYRTPRGWARKAPRTAASMDGIGKVGRAESQTARPTAGQHEQEHRGQGIEVMSGTLRRHGEYIRGAAVHSEAENFALK